jgi:hypothetical protein
VHGWQYTRIVSLRNALGNTQRRAEAYADWQSETWPQAKAINKRGLNQMNIDLTECGMALFEEISAMIEQTRHAVYNNANRVTIVLFWNIGQRIKTDILKNKRADYGKQFVSALGTQLTSKYGQSFEARNLRRMMQFCEQFPDFEIVSALPTQLSWSHFVEILPLKSMEAISIMLCWCNMLNLESLHLQFSCAATEQMMESSKKPCNRRTIG